MAAPDRTSAGSLAGKVAVVTGGASGIGRATAFLFAEEGAAVTVADVDAVQAQQTVQTIIDRGSRALYVRTDVTSDEACQNAITRTIEEFSYLDVLFNNAGIIHRTSVPNTAEADWDRVMAVNVKGVYLMSKYAIPVMARGGSIINTGAGWGLVGGHDAAPYCASKGAVVQLTRAMALDHGAQGLRVNCVCPGDTDTPLLAQEAEQLGINEQTFRAQAAVRPIGRVGRPDDVARAVLYLASEAAEFVTGATLVVEGGGLAGQAP